MNADDELERAIGEWLLRKEAEPDLLPGAFARELAATLREPFLRELEALAAIDELTTQAPPRDLPRRYGDFRVLGEIGRGAMGSVFDAEQVSTGRRVALKVLHPHVAQDARSATRFQREARTAAALVHPGIVPVLAFGTTDGAAWLAMARIDGCSLQRLLAAVDDPRDVDHERACALLDDPKRLAQGIAATADALEFAHRRGVVHRDVKPANLMLDDAGRVVVLDFGLATACEPDAASLTRTGEFLGTPLYMAPEQAVGAENGTARSDVYALGAVLYECLCRRPPVAPGPLATVIDAILNREPLDPRRARPGVPGELARIALQCLEKEPGRRYPTAAALAADLRRFVDGGVVLARNSGFVRRSLRRLRRRPAVAVLAALLCVAAPASLAAWALAGRADAQASRLLRERDLARVDELLAGAPERLTVFGGASLRFYARLGLGERIDDGTSRRSPAAAEALALADALVAADPNDPAGLRVLARARLDVGDDAAATQRAVDALLAADGADAADRMMAAVWERQQAREPRAQQLRAGVPEHDPRAAFWLGFWHQDEQDHAAAIAAFSRALAGGALDGESRYQALLHRGWCRTCPDVAALREAQDDLLQAAALRPRYGTPWLLWAALRCLEAREPAELAAPVAKVGEVLGGAEPWVHVLTARVLLGLAEGGAATDGPVRFGAELSPIAVMPVRPEFAAAFAGKALELLDGVLVRAPASFEAGYHRVAALALLGRTTDALAAADGLERAAGAGRAAAVALQRARVQLAAGRAALALTAVDAALAADPQLLAAWRFRADLAGHLGDTAGRLAALDRAAALAGAGRMDPTVFADAAAWLPELQLARARALHALGRVDEALELVRRGDFGGPLAGERSPRVRLQRHALLRQWGAAAAVAGGGDVGDVVDPGPRSPLRWLFAADARVPAAAAAAGDADVRMAVQRGWLPEPALAVLGRAGDADAALAGALAHRGVRLPPSVATAPLGTLLANLPALLALPGTDVELLGLADAALARDAANGEARLLRALVLHQTRRTREAAQFLAATFAGQACDLRSRYLLAVTARATADPELLRLALGQGEARLTARELDCAAAALPWPPAVAGEALLEDPR